MRRVVVSVPLVGLLALAGCDGMMKHGQMFKSMTKAVAVMHGTQGNAKVHGLVTFTQSGDDVMVVADIEGLPANTRHGFHIHEYGDCSSLDAKSAGGHYNPEGHDHGLPPSADRHAGDLGNVTADASGKAHLELTVHNISIAGMNNPIIGRGLILHAKPDDGGQPTGNAGARMACGVIGIARP